MRRALALLIVALAVAPGTWVRSPLGPPQRQAPVVVQKLQIPAGTHSGPFQLTDAWHLSSRNRAFGGYSALAVTGGKALTAFSDRGPYLRISLPDPVQGTGRPIRLFPPGPTTYEQRDIEAATVDPLSRTLWVAVENDNRIARFSYLDGNFVMTGAVKPPLLAKWKGNSGPEAFVRLRDGRFVILREAFSGTFERQHHAGLIFAKDPIEDDNAEKFDVSGPAGYEPTDMAQLPDGRVLVLLRKVSWSIPPGFGAVLAIGDLKGIEPGKVWQLDNIATLAPPVPIDNFEGLAAQPLADGKIAVWLISDDNASAILQRTLLLRFLLDPANVPQRKKARGTSARLLQNAD